MKAFFLKLSAMQARLKYQKRSILADILVSVKPSRLYHTAFYTQTPVRFSLTLQEIFGILWIEEQMVYYT